MSRFFKVIVNLFLVFAILVAGAILVPPLLGVSTTMIDSASMDTNLPVGSITYSQNISVSDLAVGDKIMVEGDGSAYVYVVDSMDVASGKFAVLDEAGHQTETQEVTLRNEALKVVITIPFIAYLMVAMHSVEGLIIIGLVVLFVIILFILSELWKKSDDEDDEEEEDNEEDNEDGSGYNSEMREAEDKNGVYADDDKGSDAEVGVELTSEELARAVAETYRDANEEDKAEDKAEDNAEDSAEGDAGADSAMDASGDEAADDTLNKESDGTAKSDQESDQELSEEANQEAMSFVRVARPDLDELLQKAEAAGETPEVVSYDVFDVTVVDYSKTI